MRVAFFGSPGFAVRVLDALTGRHDVALVVTQPDKPVGRGLRVARPAAAERAAELGLRLAQPARLKGNTEFAAQLAALECDVAVTAAYGKILPASLLGVPTHGFLNVHASLLPELRGAAPIQWAIIEGKRETGVTIMQTEAGLDTGPIRLQRTLEIGARETAPDLFDRLADLGSTALLEALEALEAGELPSEPQDHDRATHARPLERDDGRIRWEDPAERIYARFRGVLAWPGSWTTRHGEVLKVHALEPRDEAGSPGRVERVTGDGVLVGAGSGSIELRGVQVPGRARSAARAWANGYGVERGEVLG